MEIVAFDEDDKADGSGKAKITWISKDLLNTTHRMNPVKSGTTEGTGAIGGWEKSEMRTYLKNTIKPLIPTEVRNAIVEVNKISYDYSPHNADYTTVDDVWIPSKREVSGTGENTGANYSGNKYIDNESRMKKQYNVTYPVWWLRTSSGDTGFNYILYSGGVGQSIARNTYGIALGFCTD